MTSAGSDHDGPGTGTEPEPGAPAWLADDADPEYHLDGRAYPLTGRRFRDVVGSFASGLTVVTATTPEGPVGVTCQSFASVSQSVAFHGFHKDDSRCPLVVHGGVVAGVNLGGIVSAPS